MTHSLSSVDLSRVISRLGPVYNLIIAKDNSLLREQIYCFVNANCNNWLVGQIVRSKSLFCYKVKKSSQKFKKLENGYYFNKYF